MLPNLLWFIIHAPCALCLHLALSSTLLSLILPATAFKSTGGRQQYAKIMVHVNDN